MFVRHLLLGAICLLTVSVDCFDLLLKKKPTKPQQKPAVFLIPGIWSSRIYAEFQNNSALHKCFGERKILAWMNMYTLLNPTKFTCLMNVMALEQKNDQNVTFKVGSRLKDIEYLAAKETVGYFDSLTGFLRKRNYTNIQSFAYDFRFVPQNMREELFPVWKRRILAEKTKTKKKIILICHSMGCKMLSEFLLWLEKGFVKKNIGSVYMIAGALGGSTNAILSLINGYDFNFNIGGKQLEEFRKLATKLPSTYYLLPQSEYFKKAFVEFSNGTTLAGTKGMESIFRLKLKDFRQDMFHKYLTTTNYKSLKGLLKHTRTICFYGVDVRTKRYRDKNGILQWADGDGVVNKESLEVCKLFAHKTVEVPKETHMSILKSNNSLERLGTVFER